MKTKYKLTIAYCIYFLLVKVLKIKKKVNCKRNGINWSLDLSEGIDLSIFLFGSFQFKICKIIFKLVKKQNSFFSIIDIGSNIGDKSLTIARMLNENNFDFKIYSVEPTSFGIKKQLANLNRNKKISSNILLCKYFISNKAMPKSTFSSWNLDNKKPHNIHGGVLKKISQSVKKISLNQLIKENKIENVKIIKLDTDGHELNVLKSGYEFLKKNKPLILMEFAPYALKEHGYSINDFYKFVNKLNYLIYDLSFKKIKLIKVRKGSSVDIILTPVMLDYL